MNTFKILLVLIGFLCPSYIFADNLQISNFSINCGETKTISVNLINSQHAYTALEFYIKLPKGISVVNKTNGKLDFTKSSRLTDTHSLKMELQSDGNYKVIVYSDELDEIEGTSGALFNMKVTAENNIAGGVYQGQIIGQKLETADKQKFTLSDFKFNITIVNNDITQDQTISLSSIPAMTYGDSSYPLPPKTNEGLTLTWTSSNTSVAVISGSTLTIKGAGNVTITAKQAGNSSYNPFTKTYSLTVGKAVLTVIANNCNKTEGEENPVLTLSYSGFKYSDNESTLISKPTASTTATKDSPAGSYPINVSGGYSNKYTFKYVSGVMKIYSATTSELVSGKYYIRNAATGKYFGPGNDWGTHASIIEEQVYNILTKQSDGTFIMETMVSNGDGLIYNSGDWMDNGNPAHLTIKNIKNNYFTIAINGLYYIATDNTVLTPTNVSDANVNQKAWWQFLTQSEIDSENAEKLSTASASNPVDATFLIKDPNFGRNRRDAVEMWTPTGNNITIGGPLGEKVRNYCAESWHSTFSISQTINNVPKGLYRLKTQGFYQQDGTNNEDLPVVFMNGSNVQIPLITGYENNMATAGEAFATGKYEISPIYVNLDKAGALTMGVRLENNTNLWCIWDNFQLTYYGAVDENDVVKILYSDKIEKITQLRLLALEQTYNENVSPSTKTILNSWLNSTENINTLPYESFDEIIKFLTQATDQAIKDINNKKAIDNMYKLMNSTNVYTQEAYNKYKALADKYLAEWNAGTLEDVIDDPYHVQVWHHENNYDDFLLSAWGQTDFNSSLYINTWSVEGETDGTEFKVPFFEYYTNDNQSLGAHIWTATVNGLKPLTDYTVTVFTRVRVKDGDSSKPYGISLEASAGAPQYLNAFEQIGSSQLYIAQMEVFGFSSANGILEISFKIDDPNNISWLAFKDVKCTTGNIPGDVNEDGKVDISDIVAVINQIAGTATYRYADVNEDTKVDISDIVAIINIIANQ